MLLSIYRGSIGEFLKENLTCWGELGIPKRKKTSVKIFFKGSPLPARSPRVHPFHKILMDFATFSNFTKMLLSPSKMDGF